MGDSPSIQEAVGSMTGTLQCVICTEAYDDKDHTPRILTSCGHTICEQCIKTSWETNEKVMCPYDRMEIAFTGDVNVFKKNFIVFELLAAQKSSQPVEAPQSLASATSVPTNQGPEPGKCAECETEIRVMYSCEDCRADYCDDCVYRVHRPNAFAHHRTHDKPYQLPKCSLHPGVDAQFVCKEDGCMFDDEIICVQCLLNQHNGHAIGTVSDLLHDNKKELRKMDEDFEYHYYGSKWQDIGYRKLAGSYAPGGYENIMNNIDIHYQYKTEQAKATVVKFAEKKYLEAKKQQKELTVDEKTKEEMRKLQEDIRARRSSKSQLHSIKDIRERRDKLCSRLKRVPKNGKLKVNEFNSMKVVFPKGQMEIIDTDLEEQSSEPSTSEPSTSTSNQEQKPFFLL